MRYQEQQKLQKHQKAEIAEHYLQDSDLKMVTGEYVNEQQLLPHSLTHLMIPFRETQTDWHDTTKVLHQGARA